MGSPLANFQHAVTEREQATKTAEKTLAALERAEAAFAAAMTAHEEAIAVLEATEETLTIVQGHLVVACGGSSYDDNCDRVKPGQ